MQWAAVNEHVYSPQKADNGIQDINGLFDYGIRIRIHNESESVSESDSAFRSSDSL